MVMFMLQINATTRIALAINPVDFRKGIDTLAAYCLKAGHSVMADIAIKHICKANRSGIFILAD